MPIPARRFTVADALIIIAAVAGSLAFVRGYLGELREQLSSDGPIAQLTPSGQAISTAILAAPLVSVGCVTLFALKLRKPRPCLRRLLRQPGVVACGAVTMVVLIRTAELGLDLTLLEPSEVLIGINIGIGRSIAYTPMCTPTASTFIYLGSPGIQTLGWNVEIGTSVAAAWLLLWMTGRWRAEPEWLDRLGRTFGAYWVMLLALEWLTLYLVRI